MNADSPKFKDSTPTTANKQFLHQLGFTEDEARHLPEDQRKFCIIKTYGRTIYWNICNSEVLKPIDYFAAVLRPIENINREFSQEEMNLCVNLAAPLQDNVPSLLGSGNVPDYINVCLRAKPILVTQESSISMAEEFLLHHIEETRGYCIFTLTFQPHEWIQWDWVRIRVIYFPAWGRWINDENFWRVYINPRPSFAWIEEMGDARGLLVRVRHGRHTTDGIIPSDAINDSLWLARRRVLVYTKGGIEFLDINQISASIPKIIDPPYNQLYSFFFESKFFEDFVLVIPERKNLSKSFAEHVCLANTRILLDLEQHDCCHSNSNNCKPGSPNKTFHQSNVHVLWLENPPERYWESITRHLNLGFRFIICFDDMNSFNNGILPYWILPCWWLFENKTLKRVEDWERERITEDDVNLLGADLEH